MFNYNGDNSKLIIATKWANEKALLNYICDKIKDAAYYDMSDANTDFISEDYFRFMLTTDINIEVYYPRWRYSKAIGYFSKDKSNTIFINGYKIYGLSNIELISLFCHESGHAWDNSNPNYNVNHGDNSPIGKENTFQYSLNRYVYEYFNYEKINTYIPWYKSLYRKIKWW